MCIRDRHERAIFTVMVPAAKSGVLAGIVLGIGRAIGETMAVIMVAGNQPRLTGSMLKGIQMCIRDRRYHHREGHQGYRGLRTAGTASQSA